MQRCCEHVLDALLTELSQLDDGHLPAALQSIGTTALACLVFSSATAGYAAETAAHQQCHDEDIEDDAI